MTALTDQIVDVAYRRGGLDLVKAAVAHLAGDRTVIVPPDLTVDAGAPADAAELVGAAEQMLAVLPHAERIRPEANRLARAVATHKET